MANYEFKPVMNTEGARIPWNVSNFTENLGRGYYTNISTGINPLTSARSDTALINMPRSSMRTIRHTSPEGEEDFETAYRNLLSIFTPFRSGSEAEQGLRDAMPEPAVLDSLYKAHNIMPNQLGLSRFPGDSYSNFPGDKLRQADPTGDWTVPLRIPAEKIYGGSDVQGFQGGGRAGTAFGLQTAGLQTQRDLEEQAEEQASRQSKSSMWGNLLGVGAGIAGSMLLPGLGGMIAPKLGTFLAGTGTGTGFLGSALGKALGKGVASAVPKALTKYGVASAYKPKEYTSKTGFGLDKYKRLGDRGSAFRQRGREAAGVGMLTDIGTAIMPSPTGSGRVGTFSEQIGAGPVEWGGYTPTADWQNYLGSADFMQPGNIIPSAVDLSSSFQAPGRLPFRGGGRVSNYYGR